MAPVLVQVKVWLSLARVEALAGEIERTLETVDGVVSARVHLVLPQDDLFSGKTQASASVVVQPRSGAAMTRELTGAIAHIVASAVREVKAAARLVTQRAGGDGAVREAIEHLLQLSGRWPEVLAHYGIPAAGRLE